MVTPAGGDHAVAPPTDVGAIRNRTVVDRTPATPGEVGEALTDERTGRTAAPDPAELENAPKLSTKDGGPQDIPNWSRPQLTVGVTGSNLRTEDENDQSVNCLDCVADFLHTRSAEQRAGMEVLFLEDRLDDTGHVVVRQGEQILDPTTDTTYDSLDAYYAENPRYVPNAAPPAVAADQLTRILDTEVGPAREAALQEADIPEAVRNRVVADEPEPERPTEDEYIHGIMGRNLFDSKIADKGKFWQLDGYSLTGTGVWGSSSRPPTKAVIHDPSGNPGIYKVGDKIEGFVITDISKGEVTLKNDKIGETTLKIDWQGKQSDGNLSLEDIGWTDYEEGSAVWSNESIDSDGRLEKLSPEARAKAEEQRLQYFYDLLTR